MMKSMDTEGSELYDKYTTTWIALFHMTLGEYEVDSLVSIRLELLSFSQKYFVV